MSSKNTIASKDSTNPKDKNPKDTKKDSGIEDGPQLGYDLSRSYGRNWTKTNVVTLFDWLTVAAFNMQCLDYAISLYRSSIRNFTIYGLLVSTLSGTISLSQFGFDQTHVANRVLQGIFTFLTFSLAMYTGYMKIYQIQERLEQYIKLRQDWAIFATTIGSEMQIPIELRRDALNLIVKYKSTYLDLIKIDIEIPEYLRVRAEESLPKSAESTMQVINLPSTIVQVGIQELDDIQSERLHNKDRYSAGLKIKSSDAIAESTAPPPTTSPPPLPTDTSISTEFKSLATKSKRNCLPPTGFTATIASPIPTPTPAIVSVEQSTDVMIEVLTSSTSDLDTTPSIHLTPRLPEERLTQ